MSNYIHGTKTSSQSIVHFFIRLLAASVVLAVTAALTPGFTIAGFFPVLISALVISLLDLAVGKIGLDASPFGRGVTGFVLAASIIYFTQIFVPLYEVTIPGALLGALFYGVIDAIIPGKTF